MSRLLVLLFVVGLLGWTIARSVRRVLRSPMMRQASAVFGAFEQAKRRADAGTPAADPARAGTLVACQQCGTYVPVHRTTTDSGVTRCRECASR